MRKLVLACGILVGVVSVSMGAMSDDEWQKARHNCFENNDKSACQALINNGLASVEQCDKDNCGFVGLVYYAAGRYREAILYSEKAIALGDNSGYWLLALNYDELQDYYNAKKYYEIACNKGNGDVFQSMPCYNACNNLGSLYGNGLGVKQNLFTAKQYYGKACDFGNQMGCDNYKLLNSQGVQ